MTVPQEVEILILRSIAGDEAAFERLVAMHHGRVHYFVNRLLGDADRADDVMQHVWMSVYRQLPKLRSTQAFVVWLYQIARNQAYRALKVKLEQEAKFTSIEEIGDEIPARDSSLSEQTAELVHAALQRLSREHREALTLCYLEEMTYQEIADVLACSVGTVKSRIFYGKKALLAEIEAMK